MAVFWLALALIFSLNRECVADGGVFSSHQHASGCTCPAAYEQVIVGSLVIALFSNLTECCAGLQGGGEAGHEVLRGAHRLVSALLISVMAVYSGS